MPTDVAALTREQFDALKGTTFLMRTSANETLPLEVLETEALATRPGAARGAFLVRFRSAERIGAPQASVHAGARDPGHT
ncbi:MAG: hypothetical protein IPQ07_32960 [Myxococcales bacterium]|nr:hypothetical protein [Myxococcales bacterium]